MQFKKQLIRDNKHKTVYRFTTVFMFTELKTPQPGEPSGSVS